MNVELSDKQAEVILQFVDVALRAHGLALVEQALEIKNVIILAVNEAKKEVQVIE